MQLNAHIYLRIFTYNTPPKSHQSLITLSCCDRVMTEQAGCALHGSSTVLGFSAFELLRLRLQGYSASGHHSACSVRVRGMSARWHPSRYSKQSEWPIGP